MTVDNFDIIRSHLTFETPYDRYIVHVIKRAKDDKGKIYGVNETNRLLKSFFISSLEYFDKKIPVIKDMCDSNNARAYILPQVRNNSECLRQLLKIVVDNMDNSTISPNHLVKKAYCGYHGSRDKKWIFDIDNDNLTEYIETNGFPINSITRKEWTVDKILEFIRKQLKEIGKSEEDVYSVPTKNGHCIVSSPFNLKKANDECNMFFEGVHKQTIDYNVVNNDPTVSILPHSYIPVYTEVHGWLIKDGMALMYFNSED